MSFAEDYADHFKRKAHNDAVTIARLERELARARRALASSRASLTVARNPDPAEQWEPLAPVRAHFTRPEPSFRFLPSPGYVPR